MEVVIKKRKRSSENARAVAKDVIAKIQKGEKVVLAPILRARGYSEAVVVNPKNVTEQPGYIEEMNSYAERLERHRLKVLEEMERKDLSEEQYRTLADTQTKLTHDVQLLTGGKTENLGVLEDHRTLVAILAEVRGDEILQIDDGRTKKESEGSPEAV